MMYIAKTSSLVIAHRSWTFENPFFLPPGKVTPFKEALEHGIILLMDQKSIQKTTWDDF